MKREYRKESMVGDIRLVECRYASGLVEIASYRPAVLRGAQEILCGVINRQDPGCKWAAYTNVNRAYVGHRKASAVAAIVDYAKAQHATAQALINATLKTNP